VRELAVEAIDADDERQAARLEVVHRGKRVVQPPRVDEQHGADGALD